MDPCIIIRGARLHNLKNVTVSIPKNRFVVLTGVSGSGKSTLGFDILHKEGLRQFLEAFGMVPFGMTKPPVDSITGLSPSVSVDQHLTNRSPRSTVGTATDVYTYLRVLYARLGHRPCPSCKKEVPPSYNSPIEYFENDSGPDVDVFGPETLNETFPCPHCGVGIPEIGMDFFSFNKPAGACPTCTGLGSVRQVDLKAMINEEKSILDGAVSGWTKLNIEYNSAILRAAAAHYHFEFDLSIPVRDFTHPQRDLLCFGVESPLFRRHFPEISPPTLVRQGRFEGVATNVLRRHSDHLHEHLHEADYRDKLDDYLMTRTCPDCAGTRLRPESRAVTLEGKTIIEISRLALGDLDSWLGHVSGIFSKDEMNISGPILTELRNHISGLIEVGAGYLTLERSSPSLSAGEAQRLRLASILGSGLTGVIYVLDEPTIGLHHRDTRHLIDILRRLRDLGNTVIVIEHDLEMIEAADHVVDFGPGAGKHGGQIIASGSPAEIKKQPGSLTGDYLAGRECIPVPERRSALNDRAITICGARDHNLKNITVRLPLGLLVAVTGVSGSGKTSLVFDILDRAMRRRMYGSGDMPGDHDSIEGFECIDKIITIDQAHIGRIPRSNAATYSDTFTPIRETFAAAPDASRLKMTAGQFSFNVPGGRCERCEGAGVLTVKMHFLPEVEMRCPACRGRRFTRETLAIRYRDHDISQVLDLTVDEALALFSDVPAARSRLQVLRDVGLGYLQLGQPATTLSGGEAQRVKLAKELGRRVPDRTGRPDQKKRAGRTLYLLDEPTTGLHLADTARLLGVLRRLVDGGNTVIVVEHNLELVKAVDLVVDLGPEGGAAGGELVAEGTPEQVAQVLRSYTGQALREILKN